MAADAPCAEGSRRRLSDDLPPGAPGMHAFIPCEHCNHPLCFPLRPCQFCMLEIRLKALEEQA